MYLLTYNQKLNSITIKLQFQGLSTTMLFSLTFFCLIWSMVVISCCHEVGKKSNYKTNVIIQAKLACCSCDQLPTLTPSVKHHLKYSRQDRQASYIYDADNLYITLLFEAIIVFVILLLFCYVLSQH